MANGKLFYLVGASGSGKDSLISYARKKLATQANILFSHRYITRAADAGGENHIALSDEEYQSRLNSCLFAMSWESHGHRYAIGIELNQWLARGCTVIVNGSREYQMTASQNYPELNSVHIVVSPEIMKARLLARGRESEAAIAKRLQRAEAYQHQLGRANIVINNDAALSVAGEQFVQLLVASSAEL